MAQGPQPLAWWRKALRVGLLSFGLAVLVSYASSSTFTRVPAVVALLVVLVLVAVGVAFDILGTSVTAAELSPLNAMAAKKLVGAKQALWLVRNADSVASFSNDVVGDVSGAVTGAAATTVATQISSAMLVGASGHQVVSLFLIGLVAALTVGGKAAGKSYAISNATSVVYMAGKVIYAIERVTGRTLTGGRGPGASRRRTT